MIWFNSATSTASQNGSSFYGSIWPISSLKLPKISIFVETCQIENSFVSRVPH